MKPTLLNGLTWDKLSVYLFIDKKMSTTASSTCALKSRYKNLNKWFYAREFNRDNFNLFVQDLLAKKYTMSYINNFIKMGKHIDKMMGLNTLSDYSYFRENRNPNKEVLTPEEIQKLAEVEIKYYRNSRNINLRYKALIYFLGTTGCRIGEVLNLTWSDIEGETAVFKDTKNGETRYVPLTPLVLDLIKQLPKESEKVFILATPWCVRNDLKERAEAVGIDKNIYPHLFRHSFITTMLKNGCPIPLLARIVGHKDWGSTNRYTHLVLADLENALYSHHPLLKANQTFEMLKEKVNGLVRNLVDTSRFNITSSETDKTVKIEVSLK